MTSAIEIRRWFDSAPKGTSHMLVVTDTFDHEDYPVYVPEGKDPREFDPKGANMQRTMECYRLSLGWAEQGHPGTRAQNWEFDPSEA